MSMFLLYYFLSGIIACLLVYAIHKYDPYTPEADLPFQYVMSFILSPIVITFFVLVSIIAILIWIIEYVLHTWK